MNKEIKEILDKLNKIVPYANVPKELAYMTTNITPQECKILLDYITNLQNTIKDNEDTIIDKKECIEALETSLTHLQEELEEQKRIEEADLKLIQELEELIYTYEKESLDKILDLEDTIVDKNKCIVALRASISKLQKENQQLKADYGSKSQVERDLLEQRIDKAIEYMDRRDLEWGSDEHNKMMNILKGSEKDLYKLKELKGEEK